MKFQSIPISTCVLDLCYTLIREALQIVSITASLFGREIWSQEPLKRHYWWVDSSESVT
jgi:hypothetical protein